MRTTLRNSSRVLGSVLGFWLLSGCAATPKQVVSVARQDLDCPNAQIGKVGDDRYAASGCGRGAVYAQVCDASGCRWGRLRHGHEVGVAAQIAPAPTPAPAAREVLPAPAPDAREVLPAPAPAEREVLPAPPPANTQGATPPAAQGEATPPPAAPAAPSTATPAPVPLSQGDLSEPYDATVPERPLAQQVTYAPPQPLVDDRPPPPAPTYVWVGGYWWWGSGGWVWLPGYWCAPMVGYAYNPGYWYWYSSYWWYWPGGWSRPGSTTIIVQTAPRSQRIARVRSFTPRTSVRASSQGSAPAGVVRATPTSPAPARSEGVVRAAPATTTFRPQSSPMLSYPTASRPPVRTGGNNVRFASSPSVGRVVRPGVTPPRPMQFQPSRSRAPSFSASPSARPSVSSPRPSVSRSPSLRSSGRVAPPRAAPVRTAPAFRPTTIGRPQRR